MELIEVLDDVKLSIKEIEVGLDEAGHVIKVTNPTLQKYIVYKHFPETDEWYNINTGLTKEEEVISEACVIINNTFGILPVHHINHRDDVVRAIHDIQRILQSRTCHRLYPNKYPIEDGKCKR